MARRVQDQASSGSTAVSQRPFSVGFVRNPSVTFVNGFQKRLGAYKKTGPRQANPTTASDSESDISSLEIDSNLSDSSTQSDHASLKSPSFLPTILPQETQKAQSKDSFESNGRDPRCKVVQSAQPIDTSNSSEQPRAVVTDKTHSKSRCLTNGSTKFAFCESRASDSTMREERSCPTTAQKGHSLVLKIRRRTLTPDNHDAINDPSHQRKASGVWGTGQSSSDTRTCQRVSKLGEWQSVTAEPRTVVEPATKDRTRTTPLTPSSEKTRLRRNSLQTKKRKPHKSRPFEDGLSRAPSTSPKTKERDALKQKYKSKRRTTRKTFVSKKRSKITKESDTEQMLRLPSDPQEAVRVLEKALESINAQIKQLKRENRMEENRAGKLKTRRRRKRDSGRGRKRLSKGQNRRSSNVCPSITPTTSTFRLNEMFPVVPSLIVRDNDLHPAYKSSLVSDLHPQESHPIWRWKLGQPPLPRTGHYTPQN